ncbi:MAG: hypothetical protein D6731_25365 [Planctomycetota bacterium]|nr:MAG: hypothetical protein D6731_25365 [Planctomycetota bacterium]
MSSSLATRLGADDRRPAAGGSGDGVFAARHVALRRHNAREPGVDVALDQTPHPRDEVGALGAQAFDLTPEEDEVQENPHAAAEGGLPMEHADGRPTAEGQE